MNNDDQPASSTGSPTGKTDAPSINSTGVGPLIDPSASGSALYVRSKDRRVQPSVGLRLTTAITDRRRSTGRRTADLQSIDGKITAANVDKLREEAALAAARGVVPGLVLGCGVLEWQPGPTAVRTPVSFAPITLDADGTVTVTGDATTNPALDDLLDDLGLSRPAALIPTTWPAPNGHAPWGYDRNGLMVFVADDLELQIRVLEVETDPVPVDESAPETPQPVSAPTLLDADLQQRTAIAAARDSASLIVRGASGTGRTQTAAAIAADRVHYGETILIVSDRLESLLHIERDLSAVGLADLLLPLHRLSEHELGAPLDFAVGRPDNEEVELEARLAATTKRLQAAIDSTEGTRAPGRSLAEAIDEVVSADDAAAPTATGVDRTLSEKSISEVTSAIQTLMTHPEPSAERDGAWHGAVGRQALGSTSSAMLALLDGAKAALEKLASSAGAESSRLGMDWHGRPTDAARLARLSFLLNEPLPSRPEWLTAPSLNPLRDAVAELRTTSSAYERAVQHARLTAGDDWKEIDPTIHAPVAEARAGGSTWVAPANATVPDLRRQAEFLAANRANFVDLERHGVSLLSRLATGHLTVTIDKLPDLVELGELAHANVRPESSWLNSESPESLEASVGELRLMVNETRIAAKRVENVFTPKVLDLDLRELRNQLGEQSVLRRLTAAQRTTRAALVEATFEGRIDESVVAALPDAIGWQDAHRRLQQAERSQPDLVGSSHYRGLATDFAKFDEALAVHRRIRKLAGESIRPSDLVAIFSQTSVPDPALVDAAAQVRRQLDTWVVEARRALGPDLVDDLVVASLGAWCDDTIALLTASADAAESLEGPDAPIGPSLDRLEAVDAVHRTWDEIQSTDHNTSRLLGGDIPRSEQARAKLDAGLEWTDAVRTILDRPIDLDTATLFLQLEPGETTLADDVVEWDRHAAWIARWFRIEDRARVDEALSGSYGEVRSFLERLRVERPKLSVLLERERAREVAERFGLETLSTWAHARDLSAAQAAAAARRQMLRAWIGVVMDREHTRIFGSDTEPIEAVVERYRQQHDELRGHRSDRAAEVAVDRRALINPDAKVSGAFAMLGRAARLLADGLRPDVIVLDLAHPTEPAVIETVLRAARRRRVLLTNDPAASVAAAVEITLETDHRSMHPALGVGQRGENRVYPSADSAARPIRVVALERSAIAQRIADEVAAKLRTEIQPADILIVVPDDEARVEAGDALRQHVSGWVMGTAAELAGRSAAHVLAWLPPSGGNTQLDASLGFASDSADVFVDATNTELLETARERSVFGTRFSEEPTDDVDRLVIRLRERLMAQQITVRYPPAGVSCVDLVVDRGTSLRPIALQLDTAAVGDVDLRYRQDSERMDERGWRHQLVSVARLWRHEDAEIARLLKIIASGDSPRPNRQSSAVPPPGVAVPVSAALLPTHGLPITAPPPPPPPPPATTPVVEIGETVPSTTPVSMIPEWAGLYRPADVPTSEEALELFGDESQADIEEVILDIVEVEEPVHLARVIRRTTISRGHSPADALAARAIQGVLRLLIDDAVEIDDEGFVVFLDIDPTNPEPSLEPRIPSDDPETQRPVAEVPRAELTAAVRNLLNDAPLRRRNVVDRVAELYRWDATSADLAASIDDLIDLLIADGEFAEDVNRVVGSPRGGADQSEDLNEPSTASGTRA